MAVVADAVAARSSYVLRNRMFWPDGTMRWIEAHGKVTTDHQGNPTGTIGCVRDITDRVLVQERESDAAARALLLQEVTAALSGAWTLDQVERVVAASLERVQTLLHGQVELRVPEDISSLRDGRAFVAGAERPLSPEETQLLDTLASQCAIAAERAKLQAAHRRHRRAAAGEPGGQPAARAGPVRAGCPLRARAGTSSSTWAATGTTRSARPTGRWRSSWAT